MATVHLKTLNGLLDDFKKAGLRMTNKVTYMKYQRAGVLQDGVNSIVRASRVERLFTSEEIQNNIERFKKWKHIESEPNLKQL